MSKQTLIVTFVTLFKEQRRVKGKGKPKLVYALTRMGDSFFLLLMLFQQLILLYKRDEIIVLDSYISSQSTFRAYVQTIQSKYVDLKQ